MIRFNTPSSMSSSALGQATAQGTSNVVNILQKQPVKVADLRLIHDPEDVTHRYIHFKESEQSFGFYPASSANIDFEILKELKLTGNDAKKLPENVTKEMLTTLIKLSPYTEEQKKRLLTLLEDKEGRILKGDHEDTRPEQSILKTIVLTKQQEQQIIKELQPFIKQWDEGKYNVLDRNCRTFADAAMKEIETIMKKLNIPYKEVKPRTD